MFTLCVFFFPTSSYSVCSRTSAVADRHRGHYSKHPGQNLPRGHNQIYSHTSAEWSLDTSVPGDLCMTKTNVYHLSDFIDSISIPHLC